MIALEKKVELGEEIIIKCKRSILGLTFSFVCVLIVSSIIIISISKYGFGQLLLELKKNIFNSILILLAMARLSGFYYVLVDSAFSDMIITDRRIILRKILINRVIDMSEVKSLKVVRSIFNSPKYLNIVTIENKMTCINHLTKRSFSEVEYWYMRYNKQTEKETAGGADIRVG